ncbi:uclacyanin 1-like [Macadamia integrifolia]|uniref:uclacyanin 1-like n=1 Tax=Macadamia integrifolia TaxID=60698 RepID=UPI001C52D946|nr:uclacyanin 1-like [Macadamia integrifolia]
MEGEGRGCHHLIDRSRGMGLVLVLITVTVSLSVGGGGIGVAASTAEVHVVGGNRGWDIVSDIAAWVCIFIGSRESIVEVGSREELEACDVTNPIHMYTDGLDSITLDGVGTRFFASSSSDSCRKGLKLNIDVLPSQQPTQFHDQMDPLTTTIPSYELVDADAVAAGPTTPSAAGPSSSAMPCPVLVVLLAFLLI